MIQRPGLAQQAPQDSRQLGRRSRVAQQLGKIDARPRQPVGRQVEPPLARILTHVAGDVGQLHGNAQVTGPGQRIPVAHPHQHAHHRPHRRGDTGRIGAQVRQGGVAASHRVPGQPFKQGIGQDARHVETLDHGGKGTVGGGIQGPARIGPVQPVMQSQDRIRLFLLQVHRVIRQPAEGIERQRRFPHSCGQQARRRVERARPVPDRLDAMGHVRRRDHCAATGSSVAG